MDECYLGGDEGCERQVGGREEGLEGGPVGKGDRGRGLGRGFGDLLGGWHCLLVIGLVDV